MPEISDCTDRLNSAHSDKEIMASSTPSNTGRDVSFQNGSVLIYSTGPSYLGLRLK